MALETLIGTKKIGEFYLWHRHEDNDVLGKELYFITVDQSNNTIEFQIQNGPIKEVGTNGCQIDEIIQTAKIILQGLDKKFPCDENKYAIDHLMEALACLKARRQNREIRGVEGTNQA